MSNQNPIINNAIQANMNAMRDMLEKAATLAKEGCGYMDDGNRNAAIFIDQSGAECGSLDTPARHQPTIDQNRLGGILRIRN